MDSLMIDEQELLTLLHHWQALESEAYTQGKDPNQSPLLRGHAYGVGDGLEMAIEHLSTLLEQVRSVDAPLDDGCTASQTRH
jgi:hypothetical protein